MSIASNPRLMTAEEFLQADLGDGQFELVRGEVVRLSPPLYEHGFICSNLTFHLGSYARRTGFGHTASNDTSVQTQRGPDTVRGPDVLFFSNARWPKPKPAAVIPPIAPDVAVEVVSPGDRRGEIEAKVGEYLAAGTLAVWVVYPRKRSVVIHRDPESPPDVLKDGDAIDDQPELPGFRCLVSEIFDG
ncbi:Uma2 family endonuclease [Paludisphaera soli]|uniref:Uma2 family endonuclease n=1 Tax=Paludisphaera soli TaxID=2712865 RepID=UPI0013ED6E1E|nr:Uma2 family endonuclease [Paludisphaera soli]